MSEEEGKAESPAEEAPEPGSRPLVLLGPEPEDGSEVDALQSGLGRTVVTLDPYLLDAEAFGKLAEASAVIVPWDLGSQAGLDLVEALRNDERTEGVPILMASARPTRAAVSLALGAGASGFIFEPYEASEIQRQLEASESEAPEGAPGR